LLSNVLSVAATSDRQNPTIPAKLVAAALRAAVFEISLYSTTLWLSLLISICMFHWLLSPSVLINDKRLLCRYGQTEVEVNRNKKYRLGKFLLVSGFSLLPKKSLFSLNFRFRFHYSLNQDRQNT